MFVLPFQLNASEEGLTSLLEQRVTVHKDWMYKVMPFVGMCFASNETWKHPSMDKTPEENEVIIKMMLEKTVYVDRTSVNFGYIPNEQTYYFALTTKNIALEEGSYSIDFTFDRKIKKNFTGHVLKAFMPQEGAFGETYKNIIVIGHKSILREAVPDMKKYSQLEINVGRKKLPIISLMGFSKAFGDFQKCMGEAVTYELSDPF